MQIGEGQAKLCLKDAGQRAQHLQTGWAFFLFAEITILINIGVSVWKISLKTTIWKDKGSWEQTELKEGREQSVRVEKKTKSKSFVSGLWKTIWKWVKYKKSNQLIMTENINWKLLGSLCSPGLLHDITKQWTMSFQNVKCLSKMNNIFPKC